MPALGAGQPVFQCFRSIGNAPVGFVGANIALFFEIKVSSNEIFIEFFVFHLFMRVQAKHDWKVHVWQWRSEPGNC